MRVCVMPFYLIGFTFLSQTLFLIKILHFDLVLVMVTVVVVVIMDFDLEIVHWPFVHARARKNDMSSHFTSFTHTHTHSLNPTVIPPRPPTHTLTYTQMWSAVPKEFFRPLLERSLAAVSKRIKHFFL